MVRLCHHRFGPEPVSIRPAFALSLLIRVNLRLNFLAAGRHTPTGLAQQRRAEQGHAANQVNRLLIGCPSNLRRRLRRFVAFVVPTAEKRRRLERQRRALLRPASGTRRLHLRSRCHEPGRQTAHAEQAGGARQTVDRPARLHSRKSRTSNGLAVPVVSCTNDRRCSE
jgi:hypothetical protein